MVEAVGLVSQHTQHFGTTYPAFRHSLHYLSPPQHAELTVGNPVSPAQMDGLPFDRGRLSVLRGQKRKATQ